MKVLDGKSIKIPRLRFSQFSKPWKNFRTDELMSRVSNPVSVALDQSYQQIGIRSHGKGIFHKGLVYGKELGNKRIFWIKPDMFIVNIVFAWELAVAVTSEAEIGMVASHRFPMYEPVSGTLELDFIHRLFLTKKGKYLLGLASPGGAGRNKTLGQGTFAELEITIPTFPEQKKIADFLSAVDARIQQLNRKKELLETYKKGVMQKLFSQELRFKQADGTSYADWEEKRLDEVATFYNGKAYKQDELLDKGKYTVLRVGNFFTNENWYYSDLELEENKYCDNGDLLYAWSASFGPRIWEGGDRTIYHYHIWKVDFNELVTKEFLFQILKIETEKMKAAILNGFALQHITKGAIEKWKCFVPSIPEQQKIADFLSSLDKKIEGVNAQIEKTQQFKKGLLQKMFV